MIYRNRASAFFTLTNIPQNLIDTRDILSFSVTEEMGQVTNGQLSLLDRNGLYGSVFKAGTLTQASFGYKRNGIDFSGGLNQGNADLQSLNLERRGLNFQVMNPSGGAQDNGLRTFSCQLLSMGWVQPAQFKTYDSGSKQTVVLDVLNRIASGAGTTLKSPMVQFDRGLELYDSTSVERQTETDWQFLVRLAREWRCVFTMATNQDGTLTGVFCDPKYLPNFPIAPAVCGAASASGIFEWGAGTRGNVRSYNWKNNAGINGSGDNVVLTYPNGQPTYLRYTAATDSVQTWVIDQQAIDKAMNDPNTDASAKTAIVQAALAAPLVTDKGINWAFKMVDQQTAPNGIGYEISMSLIGDPMTTAGMMAQFGPGFPSMFRRDDGTPKSQTGLAGLGPGAVPTGLPPVAFWLRKVTHTIDKASYYTEADVVDTFTINALGII